MLTEKRRKQLLSIAFALSCIPSLTALVAASKRNIDTVFPLLLFFFLPLSVSSFLLGTLLRRRWVIIVSIAVLAITYVVVAGFLSGLYWWTFPFHPDGKG
ncbi:hypothetical protein KBD18_01365 [Patescibacteria group bacterium]|nr:hypothetical protein [Patescibacteria group bacterium]